MGSAQIRRVLVIFPGALGDLMCLMPALDAISRRHPGASVELMARFELARLVAGRSVVARAHSIDAREVGAFFADETSLNPNARRFFGDFDRIYSFFASDDARFCERLAAANDAEVSFHSFRPGGEGHVSEGYLRAVGEGTSMLDARLEPTADDLAAARALLESKCDVSNLIVIFPGSGSPAKNWPANRFAALASTLSKLASAAVILGPAEAAIEPIFREAGVPVLKDLELPTVAAIASIASAFVANDSGVAHLAAAVGASGVVIFGPTDPARWRPIGSARIDILRREPIDSVETREVAGALSKFVERRQR
jgi:ADP-heptose:LPS heptosyltransferase